MSDERASTGPAVGAGDATVRIVMPDRWLEHVATLPLSTRVEEAKELGLRTLLMRSTDDPADYFVEYAERHVRDETRTLADIGFRDREILLIRAYDLGHPRRFEG